jgi:predicted nucleic acid-binding protein
MSDSDFLDTNVLVYAFTQHGNKTEIAIEILSAGGIISIQVLNETANALYLKYKMTWEEIGQIIDEVLNVCPNPRPVRLETHRTALRICERYGYSVYDGLIIAAALDAGCTTLYTEDLQHGQIIEGLRVVNPFREQQD